jgi:hypothetical protein
MDIISEEYKSESTKPSTSLAVLQTARDFVSSLIGFFTLTEDDKSNAGINIHRNRDDE